jgi:CubicO group peptidase (beta-lactamase class C family)
MPDSNEPTQHATSIDQRGFDPAGVNRLCSVIEAHVAEGRIPGATLLMTRHGETVERAFGHQRPAQGAQATPMAIDTIFRIYSMTKPVVSVAVMMMAEQGRFLISDPVAKYLPELANVQVGVETIGADGKPTLQLEPCRAPMTIQDLLRHTAGLTYGIFGESTLVKQAYRESGVESSRVNNAEMVAKLATLPLALQPGTCWEYSRATDVLGALLERVSGQTLDVHLQEMIFGPLGMVDTGFWIPEAQQHRAAEAFDVDPVTGAKVRLIDVSRPPVFLSGGGGLVSTARDYLRFARMLHHGGALDGTRLLSRKTIDFMASDHLAGMPGAMSGPMYLPGPGYGFGLGFAVRTAQGGPFTAGSVGEFNWSGLAGTYFWIDPAEDLIAIWLMQAPEQRDAYRQLVRTLVTSSLK